MSRKTQYGIGLLAGASSIALVAVAVTLSTPTVQADARLSRPPAIAPSPAPVDTPTPDFKAAQPIAPETARAKRAGLLKGIASWYGGVFNGRKTASGERFNMYAMTACHPTLPFGSVVKVVNCTNKRSVVVKITDRGDLLDGRIIDLSYAAAEKLAMTHDGLAKVELQVISVGNNHHIK
jgi:rare lipoprotein A